MENIILHLNKAAEAFCSFSGAMLIQSSILIVLLLVIDRLIRKRVRAVFRYCIWMLVFVKLLLPPSLCLPTGVGYWCDLGIWPVDKQVSPDTPATVTPPQAETIAAENEQQHFQPAAEVFEHSVQAQVPAVDQNPTSVPPIESSGLESPPAVPASPAVTLSWQAFVLLGWLVGAMVLSVLLIQRFLFLKSLIAQSEPAGGRVLETLNRCRKQVGINRPIELRLTANMLSPAACGLLNPVILMPASLLDKLTEDKLKTVLIHELAHIKRGDLWVNFLQTVLQIAYFYNPLLWVANAVVRGIREKAVDEMVLTKLSDQADTYSNTLIDIAEIAFSRPHFSLRLVGVVESKSALTGRIKHIQSRPFPKSAKIGLVGLAAIFITAAVLLPMAKGEKQEVSSNDDLEKLVIENFIENRDRLESCVLSWTRSVKDDGFTKAGRAIDNLEYGGTYQLWWDGKKTTTKYTTDQICSGTENSGMSDKWWIQKESGGHTYGGRLLSAKPSYTGYENWLEQVIHWYNSMSLDKAIEWRKKRDYISMDWSIIKQNGVELIKLTAENIDSREGIEKGARSVEFFDVSKNYSLISREWYDSSDRLYMKEARRYKEVIPNLWFPSEVHFQSFGMDGKAELSQRLVLNLDQCSFNDPKTVSKDFFGIPLPAENPAFNLQKQVLNTAEVEVKQIYETLYGWFKTAVEKDYEQHAQYVAGSKYRTSAQIQNSVKEVHELMQFNSDWSLSLVSIYWVDDEALAVADKMPIGDPKVGTQQVLVFTLKKQDDRWVIDDIDLEELNGLQIENSRFLKNHPDANVWYEEPLPPSTFLNSKDDSQNAEESSQNPELETNNYTATLSNGVKNDVFNFGKKENLSLYGRVIFQDMKPAYVSQSLVGPQEKTYIMKPNSYVEDGTGWDYYAQADSNGCFSVELSKAEYESLQAQNYLLSIIVPNKTAYTEPFQFDIHSLSLDKDSPGLIKLPFNNPFGDNDNYAATLPNGVIVELLGVCEHPSFGMKWWLPDGNLLKESPYDDEPYGRAFPKWGESGYKFAVKLSGMAYKDMNFHVIPSEFIQTQRDNVTKKNGKENTKYVEDWIDEKIVGIGASFVEEAERCDIEVGVCFGDWRKEYRYEDDNPNDAVEWVKFENVSLRPNFDQYAGLSEKEQIIRNAEIQARLLNHEYIGTEHILLGFIADKTGTVSQVLNNSGITGKQVYDQILRLVEKRNQVVYIENLPMTDRTQLALKNATQLAKESNSDTVNSIHVLLGLLQVEESVAAQVLVNSGLNFEKAQENVALRPGGEREQIVNHAFALYRVLGHENAPSFGKGRDTECRRIIFSDANKGADHFDPMRPENYPLDGLILDEKPLLTEEDIVAYDWEKHIIHLKSNVLQRLPKTTSVWGTPFVVTVKDERLYMGAFWSAGSSYSANMPTIYLGWFFTLPEDDPLYLPKDAIRIKAGTMLQEKRALEILNDERIKNALDAIGKLQTSSPDQSSLRPDGEREGEGEKYEINGTVHTPISESLWDEYFTKLENAQDEKDFQTLLESMKNPKIPATDVVVKLQGNAGGKPVNQETITDEFGKYKFTKLELGKYVVSAEQIVTSKRTGNTRKAYAESRSLEFYDSALHPHSKKIDLELRDGYVSVTGRVFDINGNPVAGASVVGTSAPVENGGIGETDEHTAAIAPQIIHGKTNSDGYYKLEGFKAAGFFEVSRYMVNTNKEARGAYKFFVDIDARSGDFVGTDNKPIRVPLAGEEQVYRARQFLKVWSKVAKKLGGELRSENTDQMYPLAEAKDDELIGVDIVLDHQLHNADMEVAFSLIVRGKRIEDHNGVLKLRDGKDRRNVIKEVRTHDNGTYHVEDITPGKYFVEISFGGAYPATEQEVTLDKDEQKKISMEVKTDQLARVEIGGKVINKKTGKPITSGEIYSVGGLDDKTTINKDGSFTKTVDRQYLWMCSLRLSNGSYRKFGIDSRIDEQIAKKLELHVDPTHSEYKELKDDDGDGIFCDGVDCTICE